jgi:C1A family cysteine protease
MRHSVHLFLGNEFSSVTKEDKKYVLKYGEGTASLYFNALSWVINEEGGTEVRTAIQKDIDTDEEFVSGLQNLYQTDFSEPNIISAEQRDEHIKDFFTKLYSGIVTINDPGDDSSLLLTIYVPLWDKGLWAETKNIISLLENIQPKYKVDVIGLAPDVEYIFAEKEDAQASTNRYAEHLSCMQSIVQEIVAFKEKSFRFAHFILIQNCNSQGYSLDLDIDSLVRIIGEYALLGIENYKLLFNTAEDLDRNHPIITFGLSVLNFDKYYFVHYLLRKAYLHILNRENVSQETVDVNKVSQIAQRCLEGHTKLLTNIIEKEVNPLLEKGETHDQIIVAVTPKLDEMFNALNADLQSFIGSEELTLPEKEAALAQVLGMDDDLLLGNMFNKEQLTIDDLDLEPAQVFIDENNKHIVRTTDDKGKTTITSFLLTAPKDENGDIYLPIQEIKKLKVDMRESTDYIRRKSKELDELSVRIKDDTDSGKRLTEKGFVYKGTTYHLLNDIEEKPLSNTYIPHAVSESSLDLRAGFTSIKDQGGQGACTSFAITSIYEYILKKSKQSEYDLSESFVYYNVRKSNGTESEDTGSCYYDVIGSVETYGICTEKAFPYNERDFTTPPPPEAYKDAEGRLIKEAQNVNPEVGDIKSALSDGYPVAISLKIFDSFSSSNGFINRPTDEEMAKGDSGFHAMVICGFSDEDKVFIVRNSWSKNFGDKGYCYIPYSYVTDPELINMACIVTQISSDVQVSGVDKKIEVAFNRTDVNIKSAIIRILIDEENYLLTKNKKTYAVLRNQYDTLIQTLGNNSRRTTLYESAVERIESEIQTSAENQKNVNEQERPATLKAFDEQTRKGGIWIICSILFVFIVWGILFYFEKFKDWISADSTWISLVIITVLSLIALLYFPYRKKQRQDLADYLEEKAAAYARRVKALNDEKVMLHLKFHLAGMIIDRLQNLQNKLAAKYSAMKSYVGNLSTWRGEEQCKVDNMDSITKDPFISVLSNEILNQYFENNKDKITANIHLYEYFNSYSLDEKGIRDFKNKLKKGLIETLFQTLNSFTIYHYISGEKKYDYLDNAYSNISQLLPKMSLKSEPFLQFSPAADSPASSRLLFVHTDAQNERTTWESEYPKYFSLKPLSETMVSKYKLIVVQIKRLDKTEPVILKLKS